MLSGWPGMVFPPSASRRGDAHGAAPSASGQTWCFSAAERSPRGSPGGAGHVQYLFSRGDLSLWGCLLAPSWSRLARLRGTTGAERINPIRSRVGSASPCGTGEGRQLGLMLTLVPRVRLPGTEPSRRHRGAWKQPGSVGLGRSYASVAVLCLRAGLACLVSPCVVPSWKTDPKCPWDPPRKQALAQQDCMPEGGRETRRALRNPGSQRSSSLAGLLRLSAGLIPRGLTE